MKAHQEAVHIITQVRMLRGHPGFGEKAIVILEGNSDQPVYENFIDPDACVVTISFKKEISMQAIRILEGELDGILAIVDSDFDCLDGIQYDTTNILVTDTHDIETMILSSPALEKVVAQYVKEHRVSARNRVAGFIFSIGIPIGLLRWIAARRNLGLNFNSLPLERFINHGDFRLNLLGLIDWIINHTGNSCPLTAKQLKQEVEQEVEEQLRGKFNPWHVCQGHDLVEILVIVLREIQDSGWRKSDIDRKLIGKDLRLAYEYSHFQMSQLYLAIIEWEKVNKPFRILRAIQRN